MDVKCQAYFDNLLWRKKSKVLPLQLMVVGSFK